MDFNCSWAEIKIASDILTLIAIDH